MSQEVVRKEDLPETELNEWGFPNKNWQHIGNGLFIKKPETIFSFNGVRMNQEDFLESVQKVAYPDEHLADRPCEICDDTVCDYDDSTGDVCFSCYFEDILEKSKQESED